MYPKLLLQSFRPAYCADTYPLPQNYAQLDEEGQRAARLNAVCLQETRQDYITAWEFFRNYYLLWPGSGFYDQHRPSPPVHKHIMGQMYSCRKYAVAMPRGTAKSTLVSIENPLFEILTRPGSKIRGVTCTDELAEDKITTIRQQLDTNHRILADFGKMRPPRGSAPWSGRKLCLTNGSVVSFNSVLGQSRGRRTHRFIIDDPELDEKGQHSTVDLREFFEKRLTKVWMPMCRGQDSSITFINTLSDQNTFTYHMLTTTEDERFTERGGWTREIYPAETPDGKLLWPEELTKEFLQQRLFAMGPVAYGAEYLNDPRPPEGALFRHGPITYYSIPGYSGNSPPIPSQNTELTIEYVRTGGTTVPEQPKDISISFKELLASHLFFGCMDYAASTKPTADYKCLLICSLDKYGDVFLWDGRLARESDDKFIRASWDKLILWRCKFVSVEAVGMQIAFADAMGRERERRLAEGIFLTRVLPLRYQGNPKKEERIAGLEWRFSHGHIKLPYFLRGVQPFKELFREIDTWSTDVKIPHDDALDTLAQIPYIFKGRRFFPPEPDRHLSRIQAFARGYDKDPKTGLPIHMVVDAETLPLDALLQRERALAGTNESLVEQSFGHMVPVDELLQLNEMPGGESQWNI